MILIEHNGEKMLVASLDGYEGATVIAADVPPPPSDFHALDDAGVWIDDPAAREAAEAEAAILAQGTIGRFDELQARIAELEAMVMVMAPLVEQASGVSLATGDPLA